MFLFRGFVLGGLGVVLGLGDYGVFFLFGGFILGGLEVVLGLGDFGIFGLFFGVGSLG